MPSAVRLAGLLLVCVVFVGAASQGRAQAQPDLRVRIVNRSGLPASKVFVTLHSASGTASVGNQLTDDRPVALSAITGSTFLLPRTVSAGRLYFGLGKGVTNHEPPTSRTRFDKVELTTTAHGVANLTSVDFFGIPLRLDTYAGKRLGTATEPRGDVMVKALQRIRGSRRALVRDKRGRFLRYLAPGLAPRAYPSFTRYLKSMVGKRLRITSAFSGTPFTVMDYTGTLRKNLSLTLTGTYQDAAHPNPVPDLPITVAAGDLTSSVIYAGVGRWKAGPNAYNPANQPNNKYTVVYRDLLTGFDLGYWNGNGTSRYRKPAPNSTESWCKRRTATAPPLARTFYCSSFDRPPFAAARTRPARFAAFNRYAGVISSISDSYGFPYSDAGTGKVQLGLDRATTLKVTILPDRRKR